MASSQEDYAINFFQLESLINNRVPFLFFAFLQKKPDQYSTKVNDYIKQAFIVSETEMEQKLETKNKDTPVVFICEDGKRSQVLASHIQKKGFTNVFFVEGGISALLKN